MQSKNPYLTVWFNTKSTIDQINSGQIKFRFYIPIILSAISIYIGKFDDIIGDDVFLITITTVIAILFGYLALGYLFPWIILKVGKLWNGQAKFRQLQIIIGLAQIPALIILFEQIIYLIFGQVLIDFQVNLLIQWIVWIFSMRILIIGIARIQNFSYGIALLNMVITILPFFIIRLTMN